MKQLTKTQVDKLFGSFVWSCAKNGYITIHSPGWLKNIVRVELPIIGKVDMHKEVMHSLFNIFYRIEKRGLASKIDVKDFKNGGCWVARCKHWDCKYGVWLHAFGAALDLNPSTNRFGTKGNMDPGIIEEFAREGWLWGGKWRTRDPMHFEVSDEFKPLIPIIHVER